MGKISDNQQYYGAIGSENTLIFVKPLAPTTWQIEYVGLLSSMAHTPLSPTYICQKLKAILLDISKSDGQLINDVL